MRIKLRIPKQLRKGIRGGNSLTLLCRLGFTSYPCVPSLNIVLVPSLSRCDQCRCQERWTALPSYSALDPSRAGSSNSSALPPPASACRACQARDRWIAEGPSRAVRPPPTTNGARQAGNTLPNLNLSRPPSNGTSSEMSNTTIPTPAPAVVIPSQPTTAAEEETMQFARLITGQEGNEGEVPPAYQA